MSWCGGGSSGGDGDGAARTRSQRCFPCAFSLLPAQHTMLVLLLMLFFHLAPSRAREKRGEGREARRERGTRADQIELIFCARKQPVLRSVLRSEGLRARRCCGSHSSFSRPVFRDQRSLHHFLFPSTTESSAIRVTRGRTPAPSQPVAGQRNRDEYSMEAAMQRVGRQQPCSSGGHRSHARCTAAAAAAATPLHRCTLGAPSALHSRWDPSACSTSGRGSELPFSSSSGRPWRSRRPAARSRDCATASASSSASASSVPARQQAPLERLVERRAPRGAGVERRLFCVGFIFFPGG